MLRTMRKVWSVALSRTRITLASPPLGPGSFHTMSDVPPGIPYAIPPDWQSRRVRWSEDHARRTTELLHSLDDQRVHDLLLHRRWRWASSPQYQSPITAHSYTIRDWRNYDEDNDIEYEAIIRFIHDPVRSEQKQFGTRYYLEWVDPFDWPIISSKYSGPVTRWFFWTMAPYELTEASNGPDFAQYFAVLNRKPLQNRELRPRVRRRRGEMFPMF